MLLSFVIPCYRSENTIRKVIEEIIETVSQRENVVWGMVWGVVLFQEQPSIGKAAGAALVILGIALYTGPGSAPEDGPEQDSYADGGPGQDTFAEVGPGQDAFADGGKKRHE